MTSMTFARICRDKFSKRFAAPSAASTGLSALILGMALVAVAGCKGKVSSAAHGKVDFNQDVQPILASNCFSCHGPDTAARKAGLRLDVAETALSKRQGKPDVIVPGHPEKSELIKRIESRDTHYRMPFASDGDAKPMKPEEIAVLKQWIAEGAHYRPHWAFEKPSRPLLPALKDAAWVSTPVDAFVLARLEKEGLHPSPEADKATLIRRVTLDLTGLLPTPAETRAYMSDSSPQAYEHLVDRLLASPGYGEQRARYWLDYARYADTYGIHYDDHRNIWPYRDYVIKAFNSNKPFDHFTKEQIAGDLLPAHDLDAVIASGYIRAGVSSNEGGAIPEELKFNIARERAEAYGATFMGLTVGCAVCHDHKYDPTTQKDFYQLTAFFNNIDELPYNSDRPNWAPVLRIPQPQRMDTYRQVFSQRSDLKSRLDSMRLQEHKLIQHWLETKQNLPQPVSTDRLLLRLRLDEGGGEVLKNSAPNAQPASFPIGRFQPQWGETTWLWPDFRMDNLTKVMFGQAGDFEWNQPFSGGGWFMVRAAPNITATKINGALIAKMDTTLQNRGWDLSIDQGIVSVDIVNGAPMLEAAPKKPLKKKPKPPKIAARLMSKLKEKPAKVEKLRWPEIKGSAIRVSTALPVIREDQWQHIFFTYDGSGSAAGVRIYIDGTPMQTSVLSDTLARSTIRTQAPLQLGWRYPDKNPAKETRYQDMRLYGRVLQPEETKRLLFEDYVAEVATRPMGKWDRDQWHTVSLFYFNNVDAEARRIQDHIRQLNSELDKLSDGGSYSLVSEEKPTVAYAHILNRGIYSARTQRVEADTPHYLPPLPAGLPHNRLGLAEWTVSPENPLTARVTVNRMWNEVFGAGLMETTEDFGIMGQRPSNPALLDWLAVEFRESGWDVKHMYKLLVMSAAYRQSAKSTPEQMNKDPRNLLLAHGPRFRMDAEELRDIALQSSGLLVNKVGGPSAKPYQPAQVWETVSYTASDTLDYDQGRGEELYRRSLYTYWKRMAMQPNMDAFDATPRDTVCTRRQRTDTPLQALVTMNDPQWVEASRALAERVIREGGRGTADRLHFLGELVLSHPPSPRMEQVLEQSYKEMQEHYASDAAAAQSLVSVGDSRRASGIPAPELAAWTMVVSEMLNLDEALNK